MMRASSRGTASNSSPNSDPHSGPHSGPHSDPNSDLHSDPHSGPDLRYDEGKLKCSIDRSFPLSETPEGHEYLQSGASTGKVLYDCAKF